MIELMISVSIIAILAAIAIPNFMQAKMSANEMAAIASLRAIAEGQSVYKRTDWDSDGVKEYAMPFYDMHVEGADRLDLVAPDLAKAHLTGYPDGNGFIPNDGYVFYDNYNYEMPTEAGTMGVSVVGTVDASDPLNIDFNVLNRWGAHAWPAGYNLTGRNSFAISDKGVVWQIDVQMDDPMTPTHNWDALYMSTTMKNLGWLVSN